MNSKTNTVSSHQLPPGTVIFNRYRIEEILGEGGFGITYKGFDTTLEIFVAIKEYFPKGLSSRDNSISLSIKSYGDAPDNAYEKGRARFLEEARIMAKMNSVPNLVQVRDYFEENNTAYIIMEYISGKTLSEILKDRGGKISRDELLPLIMPVFPALSRLHENGLVHKDISPDNIMLGNGSVCLIDFGNARPNDGNATSNIYVRHGFSPLEQYVNSGQGPRTDIYSLAAVIYYCLTGKEPPKAVERSMSDTIIPPRELGADISEKEEKALLYALNVKPNRRYQTMDEFFNAMYGNAWNSSKSEDKVNDRNTRRTVLYIALIAAAIVTVMLIISASDRSASPAYSLPDNLPDDLPVSFDEQQGFKDAIRVSTAEQFMSATEDTNASAIIVDGNITLNLYTHVLLAVPLMINENASVVIEPDFDAGDRGFGFYMDSNTYFINNGIFRINDDSDRLTWLLNGKDYVFINNGQMEGSFYMNDADNINIINYGTMKMIKYSGVARGKIWNYGTIEADRLTIADSGLEIHEDAQMYNAGTIRLYNSFLQIKSSESFVNDVNAVIELHSGDLNNFSNFQNYGKIIADADSRIIDYGTMEDSGEINNEGKYITN